MSELHLHSFGLLSKWGFNDGDIPDHVADELDRRGIRIDSFDWTEVLCALVCKYLLPEIRKHHEIEVYEILTSHNPIRAKTVDGGIADMFSGDLEPVYVTVPMEDVIKEIINE